MPNHAYFRFYEERSYTGIWSAGIFILVSHGLNVKSAVMNTCRHVHVKDGISSHRVIRNGWWDTASGYSEMS